MTTPTTPYALFRFVPLSTCRNAYRATAGDWRRPQADPARQFLRQLWCERALTAVTAERDALRRELDAMTGEL